MQNILVPFSRRQNLLVPFSRPLEHDEACLTNRQRDESRTALYKSRTALYKSHSRRMCDSFF
eukprot:COSAG04_NODE_554_length_12674_cov_89.442068_6_plen_62_part_00